MRGIRHRPLDARDSHDARNEFIQLAGSQRACVGARTWTMMATKDAKARGLYARTAFAADRGAWSVERDIAWMSVDRARAFEKPEILAQLRDAALIESYHPVNLARLLKATWDDVDAS